MDAYVLEHSPDLRDYLFFHGVTDKFCWLIRLHYADRPTARWKSYRLDTLYQRFLTANQFTLRKAQHCQSQVDEGTIQQLERHLTKGWLNELVRSTPLDSSMLDFGTTLQSEPGPGSGGLVGWNIVQSYYSFFEYMCCLTLSLEPNLDTRGHKSVAREFSNHTIGRGRDRLVFFPFTLTSETRRFPRHPEFNKYRYARYPRDPRKDVAALEREVRDSFKLVGTEGQTTILDVLYELRLWANYTGIDSLLVLNDGGYQRFLVRNLGGLVFFAGGLAELAFLSAAGIERYLATVRRFADSFVDKFQRFASSKYLIPSHIRLRALNHLGIVSQPVDFLLPEPADPVRFI